MLKHNTKESICIKTGEACPVDYDFTKANGTTSYTMNDKGVCIPDSVTCPESTDPLIEKYESNIKDDGTYSCTPVCKTEHEGKLVQKVNDTCETTDSCSNGNVLVNGVCITPGTSCTNEITDRKDGEEYEYSTSGQCVKTRCATPNEYTISQTLTNGQCVPTCKRYTDDFHEIRLENYTCVKSTSCVTSAQNGHEVQKMEDGTCRKSFTDCSDMKQPLDEFTKSIGGKFEIYNKTCNLRCPNRNTVSGLRYDFVYPEGTEVKDHQRLNADVMYSSNAIQCKATDVCYDESLTFNEDIGRCALPLKVIFDNKTSSSIELTFTVPAFQDGNTDLVKNYTLAANKQQELEETIPWQNILKFEVKNYNSIVTSDSGKSLQLIISQEANIGNATEPYKNGLGSITITSPQTHSITLSTQNTRFVRTPTPQNPEARMKIKNATYTITLKEICQCYENGICMTKEFCDEKQRKRQEAFDAMMKEKSNAHNSALINFLKSYDIITQPTEISIKGRFDKLSYSNYYEPYLIEGRELVYDLYNKVSIQVSDDGTPTIDGQYFYISTTNNSNVFKITTTKVFKNELIIGGYSYGLCKADVNMTNRTACPTGRIGGARTRKVIGVLVINISSGLNRKLLLFKTETPDSKLDIFMMKIEFQLHHVGSTWAENKGIDREYDLAPWHTAFYGMPDPYGKLAVGAKPSFISFVYFSDYMNMIEKYKESERFKSSLFSTTNGNKTMSSEYRSKWLLD